MKLKKGFCCDQFRIAYNDGYDFTVDVPAIGEPFQFRKLCAFCGRDPTKYELVVKKQGTIDK
jgi:hypothetical protein